MTRLLIVKRPLEVFHRRAAILIGGLLLTFLCAERFKAFLCAKHIKETSLLGAQSVAKNLTAFKTSECLDCLNDEPLPQETHKKLVRSTNLSSAVASSLSHEDDNKTDTDLVELVGPFRIHTRWHPRHRKERFPSVNERVKLYMTNWYNPSCKVVVDYQIKSLQDGHSNMSWPMLTVKDPQTNKTREFDSLVTPDVILVPDSRVFHDCARSMEQYSLEGPLVATENRIERRDNMRPYCKDTSELLDMMDREDRYSDSLTPLLIIFGDRTGVNSYDLFDVPFFSKYRAATTKEKIEAVAGKLKSPCSSTKRSPLETLYFKDTYHKHMSPIVWKTKKDRHWDPLLRLLKKDIPWKSKKNVAYWRGGMTGSLQKGSDLERCRANQRCRFVLDYADSKLIDCGLTNHYLNSSVVNGIELLKDHVSKFVFMKYKIIISLEGNDVASGLKWALQSESVVLMPPPTRTSWAMEELLRPWVHYIPMSPNGSNAEEMVQWVLKNDREAKRIAERATLFMYDMVYHPEAERDDKKVKKEIVRRYRSLWR